MTRETKLGLVVAASFLALVGGVLAVKLHQGGLTTAGDEVANANGEGLPPPEPQPGAAVPPPAGDPKPAPPTPVATMNSAEPPVPAMTAPGANSSPPPASVP